MRTRKRRRSKSDGRMEVGNEEPSNTEEYYEFLKVFESFTWTLSCYFSF